MHATVRILMFGGLSGLIWSAAPGVLAGAFDQPDGMVRTLVAGVVAGTVISALLALVIPRRGRRTAIFLGLGSLPLGAFAFGSVHSLIASLPATSAGAWDRLVEACQQGVNYALLSGISVFAPVLFPCAVVTTLALRTFLRQGTPTSAA